MKLRNRGLTIQFVPYVEIAYLTPYKRVKKLLDIVGENKIIILQGRLSPEEETDLIEETMKKVGRSRKFKGIEIAVFSPRAVSAPFFHFVREKIADALAGRRDEITIIGPATLIREIKKDPTKIQLLLRK